MKMLYEILKYFTKTNLKKSRSVAHTAIPQRKQTNCCVIGMAILVLAGLSACMMQPHDEQTVKDKKSTIEFSGFHIAPGQEIKIEALHPEEKQWKPIKKAVSTDMKYYSSRFGLDLYYWKQHAVIPNRFWEPWGISCNRAQVRATAEGYSLLSLREDGNDCYWKSSKLNEYMANCPAPESPIATVYSPPGCLGVGEPWTGMYP